MDEISFAPFWEDVKQYRLPSFQRDLLAALSVALLALPQSMAYAFVADLPTSAGIFAAIFGTIFTAAFGSSRHLISGPTNTVAILIQSGTSEILFSHYGGVVGSEREVLALQVVLQIVLIVGLFQIGGGLLRLGRLTQFVSRSVVVAYLAGVALAIIITQLFPFLGIRDVSGYRPIYYELYFLAGHLFNLHLPTMLIGIGCLLLLVLFHRLSPKIPSAVIVFTVAGGVVALFGLAPEAAPSLFQVGEGEQIGKVALLGEYGPIYSGLPRFRSPFLQMGILIKAVPLAFAIALLSVLEATTIGRSYARAKDPPYSDNQEIFALGISNTLSSFFGAMPSSGSFSRSALNVALRAKTRFAGIYSGGIIFAIVALFGFLVTKIPLTALSALMLFTAFTMVNFKNLSICFRATRTDAFVVVATFLSSLIFTLDVALYIGVILSVFLFLRQAGAPFFVEYTFNIEGKLRPMEESDERLDPRICIIHPEGDLFFGAAELLQTKLRHISEEESLKVVILQIINTRHIDASICLALRHLYDYFKISDKILLLSGVMPEVGQVMKEAGLVEKLGEENFFPANEQLPSEPTRNAYAYAKTLLE